MTGSIATHGATMGKSNWVSAPVKADGSARVGLTLVGLEGLIDHVAVVGVVAEVIGELERQDIKSGQASYPSIEERFIKSISPRLCMGAVVAQHYGLFTAEIARAKCDAAFKNGHGNWAHVLVKEVCESIDCLDNEAAMRAELVQVVAVAIRWIQDLDRRGGAAGGIAS